MLFMVLDNDGRLAELLKKHFPDVNICHKNTIEDTKPYLEHDEKEENFAAWIVSEDAAELSYLHLVRRYMTKVPVFYVYAGKQRRSAVIDVCGALNVHFVPREEVLVDAVTHAVFQSEDGGKELANVISFIGTRPQVGVTSIVLAVAKRMAQLSPINIGVLQMNEYNPGISFIEQYTGEYLDGLKSQLASSILTPAALKSSMCHVHGFWYLAGNRDVKYSGMFRPEEAEQLILTARDAFDLVLIDAGGLLDNALAIVSLDRANKRFLVVDQSMAAYENWIRTAEVVLGPMRIEPSQFYLVVNRMHHAPDLATYSQLESLYATNIYSTIPDLGLIGQISENRKQLLTDTNDTKYIRAIDQIARGLLRGYRFPMYDEGTEQKSGMFRFFSRKAAAR